MAFLFWGKNKKKETDAETATSDVERHFYFGVRIKRRKRMLKPQRQMLNSSLVQKTRLKKLRSIRSFLTAFNHGKFLLRKRSMN